LRQAILEIDIREIEYPAFCGMGPWKADSQENQESNKRK
jgi:hypothetical protein